MKRANIRVNIERGALALLLFAPLASAQDVAETAPETLPLTAPASREEIMALVGQVQDQIDALPEGERSEDSPRYLELRSQLEMLLLQAELERLRVENETLQELVASASEGDAPETSLPLIQRRLADLTEAQEGFNAQLQVISEQHAAILEGSAEAEAPADHSMMMGTHVVAEGESLSMIAEAVYGTSTRWPEIFEANPAITDPNALEVGTELTLP